MSYLKYIKQNQLGSKLENPKIISLNKYILKYEDVDSDFWHSIGFYKLIDQLVQFNQNDWSQLRNDLKNWSSQSLWIIAEMLAVFDDSDKLKLINITELYGYIFTIVDEETADDLFVNLVILIDGKVKDIVLLENVIARIEELKKSNTSLQSDASYNERSESIKNIISLKMLN